MSRFKIPKNLKDNDIRIAFNNIHYLKEIQGSIDGISDSVTLQDIEFSSNKESSLIGPFYTWKKNINIEKLLSGEEIELEAIIDQGPDQSAIKFNEIGIYPKIEDEEIQKKLNNALQSFTITISMAGEAHYRCLDTIYSFTGYDDIVIIYSFKRLANGKPLMTNKLYQKLLQMDYILSPYTTWKIKLIGSKESFEKLKEFEKIDIDLELSGRGQYIQHGSIKPENCKREKLNYLSI